MIDVSTCFAFDRLPGVTACRDSADPHLFFAFPASPRISLDDMGKPMLNLVVYGRKQDDGSMDLQGGYVSATAELSLLPAEEKELTDLLANGIANPDQGGSAGKEPQIRLLSPPWIDGSIELFLTESMAVSGRTSMTGRNRCALQMQLDLERARHLFENWHQGLSSASIRFRGRIPTAKISGEEYRSGASAGIVTPGMRLTISRHLEVTADLTEAGQASVFLSGDLGLTSGGLKELVQVIAL